MKIFKDIFSNDELLCDNDRPLKTEEDVVYAVPGRYIEIGGEDYGISSNVDEDAAEGASGDSGDSGKQKVIDVVHNNRLMETSFDKGSYMAYIKGYMKKLKETVDEKDAERGKVFATGAQNFVKKVVKEIGEYQFFLGESGNDEGMVVLAKWEGETPTFYYWQDGLKAEKV